MGWWSERVVPLITDKACNSSEIRPLRQSLCESLDGRVLEVGFGSGHSLEVMPATVEEVLAVEPSDRAWGLARKRLEATSTTVVRSGSDAQAIPLDDGTADHALSVFTLCTIPDAAQALREVRRVLKTGGRFHFLEHGRSPDVRVARFQERWDPVQRRLFAGCHVSRPIAELVENAGFRITELEHAQMKGPKSFGYLYIGVAERS